jgi:hypothetical protein
MKSRVTRFAEFSPNDRSFALRNFLENFRSSPHIGATFSLVFDYVLILTNWFGLDFGRFFHKLIWSP